MLFIGVIVVFLILLIIELYSYRRLIGEDQKRKVALLVQHNELKKEDDKLQEGVSSLEKKMTDHFSFYELTRRVAPLLDKKELFRIFPVEVKYLFSDLEEVKIATQYRDKDYLKFKLGRDQAESLYIKTTSKMAVEYLPQVAKLLSLCIERIDLYSRLQQLSIYDSLTEAYNRRYFMQRYFEEFQRAKKFNIDLSFLMIDIDHFKEINDNYGHLVGDVVLRELVRVIKENIREIDFVARYGGEEFSMILLETDKAGAIMVGERIRSRISGRRIRAFDEILQINISVGLASYPQNTIHSDVLIETADKALYKAKVSGRNRVCWF